jgi:hypothetical protein
MSLPKRPLGSSGVEITTWVLEHGRLVEVVGPSAGARKMTRNPLRRCGMR